MRHKIRITDDRSKRRLIGTVIVPRSLRIPTSTRRVRTTDLLHELFVVAGLIVLRGPVKLANGVEYVVAAERSGHFSRADQLKQQIEQVLEFHLPCLEGEDTGNGFMNIDSARPNVASRVFASCLTRRSALSRRLMELMGEWLEDELKLKWPLVVNYYDDNILIGARRPSRKEIGELEDTVETRRIYLELIDLAERAKWDDALVLAKKHSFI